MLPIGKNNKNINQKFHTMNNQYQTTKSSCPEVFNFLGKYFTPFRPFTVEEKKAGLRVAGRSTGISNYADMHNHVSGDWNYDKFFVAAKNVCADKIDVFLMDGQEVVPGLNELFFIHTDFQTLKMHGHES